MHTLAQACGADERSLRRVVDKPAIKISGKAIANLIADSPELLLADPTVCIGLVDLDHRS